MCGGAASVSSVICVCPGLSPRVRGSPSTRIGRFARHRSIPACAGEPATRRSPPRDTTVYPRVCGGARTRDARPGGRAGLSPRVRGSRSDSERQDIRRRSIPACAGEPRLATARLYCTAVYPRVCGGATAFEYGFSPMRGLSPRVRGSRSGVRDMSGPSRSIPACAGEPNAWRHVWIFDQVYPRVCGGAGCLRPRLASGGGLSPRVRGSLFAQALQGSLSRSIPACAGEPHSRTTRWSPAAVYPRVCGGAGDVPPNV